MKQFIFSTFLALGTIVSACGSSNKPNQGKNRVDAKAIDSSKWKNLVFVGQAPDTSVRTSQTYRYDLKEGFIETISSGDSANAALFSDGENIILFNRQQGETGYRTIPTSDFNVGPLKTLDLTPGDPFDVAPLINGKNVLLAEPLGGHLRVLNYITNELTEIPSIGTLSVNPLRPIGLSREGNLISLVHTGIEFKSNGSAEPNGSQKLFRLSILDNGSLTFTDAKPSTSSIDGLPLTATVPSGFLNTKEGKSVIFGLCSSNIPRCTSGYDRISGGDIAQSQVWSAPFNYEFYGQIIDGPSDDEVYAHVKSKDQRYLVIKISLSSQSVEEIHSFGDERLYGIAFDISSQTLFIGGLRDVFGTLSLYKAGKKIGEITLDGVFYRSIFVSL